MTATEHVILVDENDQPIGTAEKLKAHQESLRHRAFSVFLFRKEAGHWELLLQQRADNKYHSPGLWTNTCCSHPRPHENILEAANRRLMEEMGLASSLRSLGWFHYIAHFENGLTENEIDHVLIGKIDETHFEVNPEEVKAYRWIQIPDLKRELAHQPEQFTPWLLKALSFFEKQGQDLLTQL